MEDVVVSVGSSFAARRYRCDEDIMAVVVTVMRSDALPVHPTVTQLKVWYSRVNVTQIPRHTPN